MKKNTFAIAFAVALLSIPAAYASEFSGPWVGGKIGVNRSNISDIRGSYSTDTSSTFGLEGGYNWDFDKLLVGVDAFGDFNQKKSHTTRPVVPPAPPVPTSIYYGSDVYGLDAKLGFADGKWLTYGKLGYGNARMTGNLAGHGDGVHLGFGMEYKFAPGWSLAGEFTSTSSKGSGADLANNNLTIGINYYFDKPKVVPTPIPEPVPAVVLHEKAPAPEPEPVVIVEPAPVVVPAVVPEVVPEVAPAPVPEAWKTLLDEKPVTLKGTNFDFDSAKLRPSADKQLDEVVSFAAAYKDAKLDVSGHTCSIGKDDYNLKLSQKRADAVKAYLVKKGVAADRIIAKGFGKTKPVASNKTKAGREENRRVEIRSTIKEVKKVRVK